MDAGHWLYFSEPFNFTEPSSAGIDLELIEKSQHLTLNTENKEQVKQLTQQTQVYLEACQDSYLASEDIRRVLFFTLVATSSIALISIALVPLLPAGITLIILLGLALFASHVAILILQPNHHQQREDRNQLQTSYEKLAPRPSYRKTKLRRRSNQLDLTREKTPEKSTEFKPLFMSTPKKNDQQASLNDNEISYESAASHLDDSSRFSC